MPILVCFGTEIEVHQKRNPAFETESENPNREYDPGSFVSCIQIRHGYMRRIMGETVSPEENILNRKCFKYRGMSYWISNTHKTVLKNLKRNLNITESQISKNLMSFGSLKQIKSFRVFNKSLKVFNTSRKILSSLKKSYQIRKRKIILILFFSDFSSHKEKWRIWYENPVAKIFWGKH